MESLPAELNGNAPIGRYAALPSGRHALPEEVVAENQRRRLEEAILELAGENGLLTTSVQHVLERAGTSRRVFYSHYRDKLDCFVSAYRRAIREMEREVSLAVVPPSVPWQGRLQAALGALLASLQDKPTVAKAVIVEVHTAGPEALRARTEAMSRASRALTELCAAAGEGQAAPSPITAEGVLGGIEHAIRVRLRADKAPALMELVPELSQFALLALAGPSGAADELAAARA